MKSVDFINLEGLKSGITIRKTSHAHLNCLVLVAVQVLEVVVMPERAASLL